MQIEIRGAERLSFREKQIVALKETGRTAAQIAKTLAMSTSSVATIFNRAKVKGYQVVIVLDGDPLLLYNDGGDEDVE